MNNEKTGAFIRQLRKEKGLTQKDLAQQLHITDRAVSKWERGLSAPDIATLEPLAGLLDVSISELLRGERTEETEPQDNALVVLDYSKGQVKESVKRVQLRWLAAVAAVISAAVLMVGLLLWNKGFLSITDRSVSPDGCYTLTIYDKQMDSDGFHFRDATSLILKQNDGTECRINYGNCRYIGHWWSPDSKKYVLAVDTDDGVRMSLAWLERSSESNLNAYLTMGVEQTELSKYGYAKVDGRPDIDYQFLQWSMDGKSMLIFYSFEGEEKQLHQGYFWYNCEEGKVRSVLEMEE